MTIRPDIGGETLTPKELLGRASELVPVLKERAHRTEELRRVPAETVEDLLSSGLYRIGVPKRFGGLDVDYGLALDVGVELGRGCASTSWCYSLWAAHAWLVGYWPWQAQEGLCGKSRQFGRLMHQYEYLFINPLEQGKMKWAGAVDAPALVVSA